MTNHVVRLMGGLGNQMFQYAFARHLAHAFGQPVRLDTFNGFSHDDRGRTLGLDAFQAAVVPAAAADVPAGMNWGGPWHRVARTAWSAVPDRWRRVVYERRQFTFDASLASPPPTPRYYFGYWQHPGYIEPIEKAVRDDFQPRQPLAGAVRQLADEMAGQQSVSVHVRSYLDVGRDGRVIPEAQAHHGTCTPDFYRRAVDFVRDGKETVCYVFADNVDWARSRLDLPVPCRYVADLVRCTDAEEMLLMAACRDHVISNSTFSWWGAWLGRNPRKVVVAPTIWIRNLPADAVDICPREWVRM